MANSIGMFQLELFHEGREHPAVIGTDGISWTDRRWSNSRAYDYIASLARDYCERHNEKATMKLEWRGTVYLLDGRYRSIKVA
jgi:hypothetical protein